MIRAANLFVLSLTLLVVSAASINAAAASTEPAKKARAPQKTGKVENKDGQLELGHQVSNPELTGGGSDQRTGSVPAKPLAGVTKTAPARGGENKSELKPKQSVALDKDYKSDKKVLPRRGERSKENHFESVRAGLVPPPPPETPSLMSAPFGLSTDMMQQFMPVELMSPASLKARQKALNQQLQAASSELKDKQARFDERSMRVKQFIDLFNEGVISRRELELSQDEIKQSKNELDVSTAKVADLQSALERIDEKLKHIDKLRFKPQAQAARDGTAKSAAGAKYAGAAAMKTQPATRSSGIRESAARSALSGAPAVAPATSAPTPTRTASQPEKAPSSGTTALAAQSTAEKALLPADAQTGPRASGLAP